MRWTTRLAHVSLLIALVGMIGCATMMNEMTTALDMNPLALERALARPADPQAEQQATTTWRQDERSGDLLNNHPRRQELEQIMRRLVAVSHKPELNPVIGIVNEPVINASVDRSGYVRVYKGLLEFTSSEDAVAGVLAHELSHVDAGHINRQMTTSLVTGLAAYGATRFVKNETADQVIQTVASAIGPAYSRKHEREADVLGTVYAHRAGFNPRALDAVFTELARLEGGRQRQWENQLRQSYNAFAVAVNRYQASGTAPAAQAAQQTQEDYVRTRQQYVLSMQGLSPLFRSHPMTEERRATVLAVTDFLEGKRQFHELPDVAQSVIQTLGNLEAQQAAAAGRGNQPPQFADATSPATAIATSAAPVTPLAASGDFKVCPVDGLRYSPYLTDCPQHHVPLESATQ